MTGVNEGDDTQWLTDSTGEIVVGIRSAMQDGKPLLELFRPDGQRIGAVTSENAARVIEKLQRGIAFMDIVGDARFGLDVTDL